MAGRTRTITFSTFHAPLPPPSVPISNLLCTDNSEARHPTTSDDDGPDHIAEVENEVSKALDDLEATGALQQPNRMTIEEFLNPIEETHHMFQATDQDIYDAVMDAKVARERVALAGGSAQSDDADDEPVKPTRTRKEVLQAALIVEEYISELDGPYARNLESALRLLAKQTRFMDLDLKDLKDAKLASYFKRT